MDDAFSVFDSFFGGRDPFDDFSMMGSSARSLANGSNTGWDVKIVTVKRADGSTYTERYDSRTGTRATSQAGSEAGDPFTTFSTDLRERFSAPQGCRMGSASARFGPWGSNSNSTGLAQPRIGGSGTIRTSQVPTNLHVTGSQVRPAQASQLARGSAAFQEFVLWRSN